MSLSAAWPLSQPYGCAVIPFPEQPSKPWSCASSFCPKKQPLSPRKQQVMQGQEHHRNPTLHLLFSALPVLLPHVSGVPAFCHSHPRTDQPSSPHHGQWGCSLGTASTRRINSTRHPPIATLLPSGLRFSQVSKRDTGSHGAGAVHPSGAVSLGVPGGTAGGVQGVEFLPAGRQPLHLPPDLPQLLPPAAVSPAPGLCRDGRWALWSACQGSRNTTPHTTWALVRGMKAKTWH